VSAMFTCYSSANILHASMVPTDSRLVHRLRCFVNFVPHLLPCSISRSRFLVSPILASSFDYGRSSRCALISILCTAGQGVSLEFVEVSSRVMVAKSKCGSHSCVRRSSLYCELCLEQLRVVSQREPFDARYAVMYGATAGHHVLGI
jgi:hypothetical protein